ncbi:MAG: glycosyl transferase family 4, partial [Actinomycetia bacterium]|nr:glycosyl transferase family 4 [Actinomycetes bacterium]
NQGKSPFAPDKQHLHHRLLELGHSHRRAVLIMYFWVGLLASLVIEFALAKPIAEALHVATALTVTVSFAATCLVGVAGVVAMIVIPRLHGPVPLAPATPAERPREAVS